MTANLIFSYLNWLVDQCNNIYHHSIKTDVNVDYCFDWKNWSQS